jgi:hypothetical protein
MNYAVASHAGRLTIAGANPLKFKVLSQLVRSGYTDGRLLLLVNDVIELDYVEDQLNIPVLQRKSREPEVEDLIQKFKNGAIASLGVYLPEFEGKYPPASVIVQIGGYIHPKVMDPFQKTIQCLLKGNGRMTYHLLYTKDCVEEDHFNRVRSYIESLGAVERYQNTWYTNDMNFTESGSLAAADGFIL